MSRGACIRDFDPPGWKPEVLKTKHPPLPKLFAIRVRDLYFKYGTGWSWTNKPLHATTWTDRTIPDGIVERWNKVPKRPDDATIISGIIVMGTTEVVDITNQRTPVSDLWDHF